MNGTLRDIPAAMESFSDGSGDVRRTLSAGAGWYGQECPRHVTLRVAGFFTSLRSVWNDVLFKLRRCRNALTLANTNKQGLPMKLLSNVVSIHPYFKAHAGKL